MKQIILLLASLPCLLDAQAQTVPVLFSTRFFSGGGALNRQLTLTPDHPFLLVGTNIVSGQPISRMPTNGLLTLNLVPDGYTVTMDGINASMHINVTNYNGTLNATDIADRGLAIYSGIVPLPGVSQIIAGTGATVTPSSGLGTVTIGLQGTGSGIGLSDATNVVTGASGVIQSTSGTAFKFSQSGTNAISAIAQAMGDARYDAINSALAVQTALQTFTNSLGGSAFLPTNTWDLAGSWKAATNGMNTMAFRSTNDFTSTNDIRALTFGSSANKYHGSIFADAVDGTQFVLGNNQSANPGVYAATGANGAETFFNFGVGGFQFSPQQGSQQWLTTYLNGDPTWRMTDYFDHVASGSDLNSGAPQSTFVPFNGGSAASLTDLPVSREQMHQGLPGPFIGVVTIATNGVTSPSNPTNQMTPVGQLTNMAIYFRTSGIAGAFANSGCPPPMLWADAGWEQTNRQANGALQEIATLFPGGMSNVMYIVHTNGSSAMFHIYHTAFLPIQNSLGANDTAFRFDISGINNNSYPSKANLSTVNYTYPAIDPLHVANDFLWFYTNGIDGVIDADTQEAGQVGYDHYRLTTAARNILYPKSTGQGGVYWQSLTNRNGGGIDYRQTTDFASQPAFRHQLWLAFFDNHDSSEVPIYAYVVTPDQLGVVASTNLTLGRAMGYVNNYKRFMTNWPAGTFPLLSTIFEDVSSTMSDYTNWYNIVGEFNACSVNGWYGSTWNTNQTPIATNSFFLQAQQDVQRFPWPVMDDNTNSVWVRAATNGGYYVLAVNQTTASSNFNVSLTGFRGIPTNVVFQATNVISQASAGLVTNAFIAAVPANSTVFMSLYPRVVTGGGTGDMHAANNLSDVANAATALANIGGVASSSGTAANLTAEGTFSGDGTGLSLNAGNISTGTIPPSALPAFVVTNNLQGTFTNNVLTNSGPASFKANTTNFANAYFQGSINGSGSALTNQSHFTNYFATTNVVLPADGNAWSALVTNGPTVFLSFAGNNIGALTVWVKKTNVTVVWPPSLTFLGYSNNLSTNGIIDFQPFGGTNNVLTGQSEL